ncbi:MAG TPA: nucleoside triphosphate pyrophosphohydrolase [Thermoanaerobaculia bacterium]|nr:nucleoside triphosphate pyrophosphohydrolase [Thermoanaerobaculia bacterium]
MEPKRFDELVALMTKLRAPGGCPWDREQTLETLRPFVIEEAYEVVEAIDSGSRDSLREELGDLLLQSVFLAEVAREEGTFDIGDVIGSIHDKLVRRHPHVFADVVAKNADAVLSNWEKLKSREREAKDQGVLSGVPASLPALLKAHRLTEKAARVGFDWEKTSEIFDKIEEEVGELREAVEQGERSRIEDELGDLLFALVNIARRMGIDSENALQQTNRKFIRRFEHIESSLRQKGRTVDSASLAEMDELWNEAKAKGL